MVKQILRRVLGQASLNYEELNTVLCDTESLISSRPLTCLSEDAHDLIALSPSMFLQENKETGVPGIDNIDATYMRKTHLYLQRICGDLRKRFRLEYLGHLKHANLSKIISKLISIGDIVLVGSDNLKRLQWPVARVVEGIPRKGGTVTIAKLKTKSGIVTRSIQRIYPLQLSDNLEGPVLRDKAISDYKTPAKIDDSKSVGQGSADDQSFADVERGSPARNLDTWIRQYEDGKVHSCSKTRAPKGSSLFRLVSSRRVDGSTRI
ncbi:hypothetical protein X975_06497, partial [Stegodyphus mimosarum]